METAHTLFKWDQVVDYARRSEAQPPKTQYELPGVTQEDHNGVPVAVPPAWHAVVTAKLAFPPDAALLRTAQQRLARALEEIESIFPLQPSGLFMQVAYGLSYFKRYLPAELVERHMPRAIEDRKPGRWAIIDAIRFPKDPSDLVLEHNDICFHFKSDYRDHITEVIQALFYPGENYLNGIPVEAVNVADLFRLTSIRRGFLGKNLPKIIGMRERISGAHKIPDGAMLFMGFTSSHIHGLAQGNLPSFETIPGYTNATPPDYFAGGTAMHLSHILIDLEAWYRLDHHSRLHRMFNPRRTEGPEVLSPSQVPDTVTFREQLEQDARIHKIIGHNEQMQHLVRLIRDTTTLYGERLGSGTVIFLRQDFDTIENPFEYWSDGPLSPVPRAGVHFVGMAPSAQLFERVRREMDSIELQQGNGLPDENVGFTKFLTTTHRQNFLLPPRAHRSFPLAEL
jgi:hypothetical protein